MGKLNRIGNFNIGDTEEVVVLIEKSKHLPSKSNILVSSPTPIDIFFVAFIIILDI